MKNDKKVRKLAWLTLLAVALLALAMVSIPVWVIQPFKSQTARGLELSYSLRRWSPLVTVIGLVIALLLAGWLWRGARWWLRVTLVVLLAPVLASAWFARQNHFEWMFHPLSSPAYATVGEATFVQDTDMVLAIENGGEAVAYPVRLMAYHHVVQDIVGGLPVVATY